MIKRSTFSLPIEEETTLWLVPVPEGASKARPLAAYELNGDSHEWDSWEFESGVLKVSFGVDPVAGELEYEYQIPGEEPTVIQGSGGVITINVTQNNTPRS